jgi:acid phosphatase (class A)
LSPSYPSGHATRGLAYAAVLAELVPERREALLERGRQVGVDRVIGGVHWPSDIEAGQRLGAALVEIWLADPANRRNVDETRAAEWLPAK